MINVTRSDGILRGGCGTFAYVPNSAPGHIGGQFKHAAGGICRACADVNIVPAHHEHPPAVTAAETEAKVQHIC